MKIRKSFTLLETMLAITIIVMILGTVFSFYNYSLRLTSKGRERLEDTQLARVLLHKIASDLKGMTTSGVGFGAVLTGEPDEIKFLTTIVPSRLIYFPQSITDKGRVIEHDLRSVDYYLLKTEDNTTADTIDNTTIVHGLQRDELRCLLTPIIIKKQGEELTPEELAKAEEEENKFDTSLDMGGNKAIGDQPVVQQSLISDRIKYLRFDYYDGANWLSQWHATTDNALPRAIMVTVGFIEMLDEDFKEEQKLAMDERPWHEDRYSLIVNLVLSDESKPQGQVPEDNETGDNLSN